MSITNRLVRLFKADVHAILDSLEEPKTLLLQAMREMEDELNEGVKLQGHYERSLEALRKHLSDLSSRQTEYEEQVRLCLSEGSEELVRQVIRRNLEGKKKQRRLQQEIETRTRQHTELFAKLKVQREKLNEIKTKAEEVVSQAERQTMSKEEPYQAAVSEQEVEVALLEEKARFAARKEC